MEKSGHSKGIKVLVKVLMTNRPRTGGSLRISLHALILMLMKMRQEEALTQKDLWDDLKVV